MEVGLKPETNMAFIALLWLKQWALKKIWVVLKSSKFSFKVQQRMLIGSKMA
uniref:Uncharacterized protein n=1 Tax=Anguilla anguilla TaxID=7936 RepID=A0A0E9PT02_ANGAN